MTEATIVEYLASGCTKTAASPACKDCSKAQEYINVYCEPAILKAIELMTTTKGE